MFACHGGSTEAINCVISSLQMLLAESAYSDIDLGEPASADGLSFRNQMLLLVSCGLLVPFLNENIMSRLTSAVSEAPLLPAKGVLKEFTRLPRPIGRALSLAVGNPMLQVSI